MGGSQVQYLRKSLRAKTRKARFFNLGPQNLLSFLNHYTMLRTSLGSISSNRRPHTSYTPYQRELIHETIALGITSYRINKSCEISTFIVRFIVFNALIRHVDDSKPRFDRSKKLIIRDKRHILRIVRRESRITYKNLITKNEIDVSHDIVYRLLKETNIIN